MTIKKLSLITLFFTLLITAVAAVSAQDESRPERPRPPRHNPVQRAVLESLAEDTGLENPEIRDALSDHTTTWADLILANGGDVDASIEKAVAAGTERVNQGLEDGKLTEEKAAQILENLPTRVSELVNNPRPEGDDADRPHRPHNGDNAPSDDSVFDTTSDI